MRTIFTPGPWSVQPVRIAGRPYDAALDIVNGSGLFVCRLWHSRINWREDAAMLAAAPDLATAAKLGLTIAEKWAHDQLDGTSSLGAALAELEPIREALRKAGIKP